MPANAKKSLEARRRAPLCRTRPLERAGIARRFQRAYREGTGVRSPPGAHATQPVEACTITVKYPKWFTDCPVLVPLGPPSSRGHGRPARTAYRCGTTREIAKSVTPGLPRKRRISGARELRPRRCPRSGLRLALGDLRSLTRVGCSLAATPQRRILRCLKRLPQHCSMAATCPWARMISGPLICRRGPRRRESSLQRI